MTRRELFILTVAAVYITFLVVCLVMVVSNLAGRHDDLFRPATGSEPTVYVELSGRNGGHGT